MLPKTAREIRNGGLYHQAVRCGKARCRCARGELHEGYYYYFTRVCGKLRKRYVRKSLVEGLAQLTAQAAAERALHRRQVSESNQRLRELRMMLREISALRNAA